MTGLNGSAMERQDIEALLPWHAAGTLSVRDAERVERALASDRELARHYDLVREELNETILFNESLGAPSARAMEKLFAAIDGEAKTAPARRSFDLGGRIAEYLSSFSPRTLAWSATAAAVAIFVQAAVLTTVAIKDQPGQGVELASYGTNDGTLAVIRFAPQASAADVTRFLDAHKIAVIDGPNMRRGGLYTIRLVAASGLPRPEIARLIRQMQNESKIVEFIAAKD